MSLRVKHFIAVLAVVALTSPVWARTYKETIAPDKDTMIGGTQLKAGSYDLAGDPAKKELQILLNGKVMATVPGQWIKLPQKPHTRRWSRTVTRSPRCSSADPTKHFNCSRPEKNLM